MNKMYVEPLGGLCNRMNCIVSAIVDSKKYGFDLTFIWNINQDCAIKFTELMEPIEDIKFVELLKMGYRRPTGPLTLLNNTYTKHLMNKCDLIADEPYVLKNFIDIEKREEAYKSKSIYVRSWCGWVGDNRDAFNEVRNLFIPKELYKKKLEQIFAGINKDKLYGFHIRRTDHLASIQNCPTELFTNKMDELAAKDNTVKFYLATDDYQLEQKLKEKYKDNIIQRQPFSERVRRDSKNGMMDAYVDLLCLASCKVIFGSESTFSALASYFGNNELLVMMR